jgi:hypothetical protein
LEKINKSLFYFTNSAQIKPVKLISHSCSLSLSLFQVMFFNSKNKNDSENHRGSNRNPKSHPKSRNPNSVQTEAVDYLNRAFVSDTTSSISDASLPPIYTVSKKYSNDDKRRKYFEFNHSNCAPSVGSNLSILNGSKLNANKRLANSSAPALLGQGVNLLDPNSVVIDASRIDASKKVDLARIKIKAGQLKQDENERAERIITRNGGDSNAGQPSSKLLDKLKSPFVYIPIIIVFLVAFLAVIAGATYIFVYKSLSMDKSSGSSSKTDGNATKELYQTIDATLAFQFNNSNFNKNVTLPGGFWF